MYQHRVKVFSQNGIIEGLFLPERSDEYAISIFVKSTDQDGLEIVWNIPWEMVFKATFFPEKVEEVFSVVLEQPKQTSLFAEAR